MIKSEECKPPREGCESEIGIECITIYPVKVCRSGTSKDRVNRMNLQNGIYLFTLWSVQMDFSCRALSNSTLHSDAFIVTLKQKLTRTCITSAIRT